MDNTRAHQPAPAHLAIGVGAPSNGKLDVLANWNTGLSPDNPTEVNPDIQKHYVYLSKDQNLFPTDPNLYYQGEAAVNGATGSYNFTELNYDGSYLWKIEEGLDNGDGGVYPPGDPNIIDGTTWKFDTLASLPVITDKPDNARIDAGEDILFSITVYNLTEANYQW